MLSRIDYNKVYGVVKWFLPFYLFTFLLLSCGPEGNKFRMSGRLRNINQGEFLVYSPDGGFVGVDTIKVRNGRFSYEKEVRNVVTLVVVFPNFAEQVVFASPGEEVDIKGDATHLRADFRGRKFNSSEMKGKGGCHHDMGIMELSQHGYPT